MSFKTSDEQETKDTSTQHKIQVGSLEISILSTIVLLILGVEFRPFFTELLLEIKELTTIIVVVPVASFAIGIMLEISKDKKNNTRRKNDVLSQCNSTLITTENLILMPEKIEMIENAKEIKIIKKAKEIKIITHEELVTAISGLILIIVALFDLPDTTKELTFKNLLDKIEVLSIKSNSILESISTTFNKPIIESITLFGLLSILMFILTFCGIRLGICLAKVVDKLNTFKNLDISSKGKSSKLPKEYDKYISVLEALDNRLRKQGISEKQIEDQINKEKHQMMIAEIKIKRDNLLDKIQNHIVQYLT